MSRIKSAASKSDDDQTPHQPDAEPQATLAPPKITRDKISLEAVINVLVQQGLCSEEQLVHEEQRLHLIRHTMAGFHFVPVQIKGATAHAHGKDGHTLRQWASRKRWSRKLGSLIFGWKWKKQIKPRR